MTTVRDLLGSTLRLINVLGAGESIPADDAADGLVTLNQMLSTWSADGAAVYANATNTKVLTPGTSAYTMGSGGDINTTRPVRITKATINEGTWDEPLNIWVSDVYAEIVDKTTRGTPTDLYVNPGNPLLTLTLSPVPAVAGTLTVYSQKPLTALALNDTLDLPPGYEQAIRFNLGIILAPEYEREPSQTVRDIARDGYATIKRNNRQYSGSTLKVDPALLGPGSFNIYRGY